MIKVRLASERGKTTLDWLESKHTFSFADYHDEHHMGFGPLRVINEDMVKAGQGFGAHSHHDMEIITFVIQGALEHRDNLGHGAVIHAGEVQRMSSGTGVTHSEFNYSQAGPVHFLQIWIVPDRKQIPASYEQKKLKLVPNQWSLVADRTGGDGTLIVHQDVILLASRISKDSKLSYSLKKQAVWLQVVKGMIMIDDIQVKYGDGVAIEKKTQFEITAIDNAYVLLFDLPIA